MILSIVKDRRLYVVELHVVKYSHQSIDYVMYIEHVKGNIFVRGKEGRKISLFVSRVDIHFHHVNDSFITSAYIRSFIPVWFSSPSM